LRALTIVDPPAIDGVADLFIGLDVPAVAVDDGAAHALDLGRIGQDVAPAGHAFDAAGNDQHTVIAVHGGDHG
jgi:hypothetical protein